MRALAVVALALVTGCDPPSPSLHIRLTDGATQPCPSVDCTLVPLACPTWISIRILDPADPSAPFLSQCQEVPLNRKKDLCSIASVDLAVTEPLPLQDLEVQVALYPESMITTDPESGADVCPSNIQYDAVNGFPIEIGQTPALGGRAYYRPGDDTVTVTLGCTDLDLVNDPVCVGTSTVNVAATVDDFDTRTSVVPFEANRLSVSVGEPQFVASQYVLDPQDLSQLDRTVTIPPAWGADVDRVFSAYACLAVLETAAQSTTTVTCQPASPSKPMYEFPTTGAPPGVRMVKATLDQILRAVPLSQFPPEGLTVGLVLDRDGKPLANQAVSATGGTVQYLSSDRNSVVGTMTSASGVFVSLDAPFGTVFSTTSGLPPETPTGIGGRIENKVTIVILRFTGPVVGGG